MWVILGIIALCLIGAGFLVWLLMKRRELHAILKFA